MACSSEEEVGVFIDTNLGTHFAMGVSPNITAGDFKRELERAHFKCFPKVGVINVYGVMVKLKSNFYHLPDSMRIKDVFQGHKGTWFLSISARPLVDLDKTGLYQCTEAEVGDCNSSNVNDSLITSTEKNDIVRNCKKGRIKSPCATTLVSEELSRTVVLSERTLSRIEMDALPQFTVRTPPRTLCFPSPTNSRPGASRKKSGRSEVGKRLVNSRLGASKNKSGNTEVGKCLVRASKNLSTPTSTTRSTISTWRFKNKKVFHNNASSMAKYLVFEISDEDD